MVNLEKKNKRRPVYDRLRTIKNMKRRIKDFWEGGGIFISHYSGQRIFHRERCLTCRAYIYLETKKLVRIREVSIFEFKNADCDSKKMYL